MPCINFLGLSSGGRPPRVKVPRGQPPTVFVFDCMFLYVVSSHTLTLACELFACLDVLHTPSFLHALSCVEPLLPDFWMCMDHPR